MEYELLYLIPESKKTELDAIKKDVHKIVQDLGGVWKDPQIVEARGLAYKIQHHMRGIYVAQRFTLETQGSSPEKEDLSSNPIATITRSLNLIKNIMRFLIVKADELPALLTADQRKEKRMRETISSRTDAIDKELEKVLHI